MRRFWIILLVVATAMVMALPATAKKPPKPDPDPTPVTTYLATIERISSNGVKSNGVETNCGGPIVVTRTDERRGAATHFESWGANLDIQAGDLAWNSGTIDDCHGAYEWPEYFRITLDGDLDGDQLDSRVAMLWIFDVEIEEKIVIHPKSGKKRTEEIRTDFRMGGPYDDGGDFAAWGHKVDKNGVITASGTGTFNFVQFESGRDPLFHPLDQGSRTFALQITLTPLS